MSGSASPLSFKLGSTVHCVLHLWPWAAAGASPPGRLGEGCWPACLPLARRRRPPPARQPSSSCAAPASTQERWWCWRLRRSQTWRWPCTWTLYYQRSWREGGAGTQAAGVAALEVHALQAPCFPQALPRKTSSILSLRRFRTPPSAVQDRLVVLGGAFNVNGNVNPAAEANVFGDPDAANVVFSRRANGHTVCC